MLSTERSFEVLEDDAGQRLDRFLTARITSLGRNLAGHLCKDGKVRVDGRRQRKSFLVQAGMLVTLLDSGLGDAQALVDLDLNIVYEDERIVVVDKRAGVPCAALPGREGDTLAGALLARFSEMSGVGFNAREPGLVHRLDTQTSGLVLAAKDQEAFDDLRAALSRGLVEKRYLAIVPAGVLPSEGTVELPLEHDTRDRRKVRVSAAAGARPRSTRFLVLEERGAFALVEASATSAFRHQIRVHLASQGAPLVGDVLYGGIPHGAPRHALHASYIAGAGEKVARFLAVSPLPDDLRLWFETASLFRAP